MAIKDPKPQGEDAGKCWATPELERLWVEEAERRYQDYLDGKEEAVPGEEAIRRIRATLR
jgi:Putative addiction module component